MVRHASLFSQLLALFDRKKFYELVFKHKSERYSKGFNFWDHFVAMLLIKYLKFKSKFGWSLSNLVAFLRWNLFTYRNLWEWIDSPFDTLPIEPKFVQYPIPFRGFGQHLAIRTT